MIPSVVLGLLTSISIDADRYKIIAQDKAKVIILFQYMIR